MSLFQLCLQLDLHLHLHPYLFIFITFSSGLKKKQQNQPHLGNSCLELRGWAELWQKTG